MRRPTKKMVVFVKAVFSRLTGGHGGDSATTSDSSGRDTDVRILAFEAARAMSRLVTLHNSLTDTSIDALTTTTVQSRAVARLNSDDRNHLIRLACAEMLDDLDRAAAVISRLAAQTTSPWPRGFSQVYADLKSGTANFNRVFGIPTKMVNKKMKTMESFVAATSNLYAEMETLAEMDASERKLERWKNYSGPITAGGEQQQLGTTQQNPPGAEAFLKKLALQRKIVTKLQEESLWCQKKEKVSELMARAAVTVFTRICTVFSTYVPELPFVQTDREGKFRASKKQDTPRAYHMSGPLDRQAPVNTLMVKFSGPIPRGTPMTMASPKMDLTKWATKMLEPPANSAGTAGMALRYADVIVLAEKMFQSPELTGEDEREELYQMIPLSLRSALKAKLRSFDDRNWRKDAGELLEWLAPMAYDTIKWCSERSCEKQRIDPSPKVWMLQTLEISDRFKAEEAIVDILVGLSFLYQDLQQQQQQQQQEGTFAIDQEPF